MYGRKLAKFLVRVRVRVRVTFSFVSTGTDSVPVPALRGMVRIPHWIQNFTLMEQNFMDGGWGCGEGWGLGVRVLHFSHFHDEKSAFFQLEVRGLP